MLRSLDGVDNLPHPNINLIKKKNTFDKEFFSDVEMYLKDSIEDCFNIGELSKVDRLKTFVQKLYDIQYLNDQILHTDSRAMDIVEFGENGVRTILLTNTSAQSVNLPSKAFQGRERKGALLHLKRFTKEYQAHEMEDISYDDIEVADNSVGLWFHDIRSINTVIKQLQGCKRYLIMESSRDIKKQLYDLEEGNEAVQNYVSLCADLEELESKLE